MIERAEERTEIEGERVTENMYVCVCVCSLVHVNTQNPTAMGTEL